VLAAAPPAARHGFRLVRVMKASKEGPWSIDFSPDGKLLATAGDMAVRLWDVRTGKMLRQATFGGDLMFFACFAQGGRTLICSGGTATSFHLVDVESLKTRVTIPVPEGPIVCMAISPDGSMLGIGRRGPLTLWDVATGKRRATVRLPPVDLDAVAVVALAFSQDRCMMAVATRDAFARLCDVKAGKEVRRCLPPALPRNFRIKYVAFIPDSNVFVAGSQSLLCLWDADRGSLVRQIGWDQPKRARKKGRKEKRRRGPGLLALAISPDGKTIAAAYRDRRVRLWETATGRLRRETPFLARKLAFAPRGGLLAMVPSEKDPSLRGRVTLWDWRDPGLKPPSRPTPRALERLWSRLAGEDAGAAYLAIAALAAHPKEATALLAKRLRRVEPMPVKEVERHIAALDSDDFEARERAFSRLEALGKGAEGELRAASAKSKSLEVRKRTQELLGRMGRVTPERLRALRAVEVLERVASAEAKRILARLAKGAAGALETQDTKAALERLSLAKASKP
jgi:hypothetical protein